MIQPTEPRKEDCCNSGCNPCIFDVYEQQLKRYKKFLQSGESSSPVQSVNAISQINYTAFRLVKSEKCCDLHILLSFHRIQTGPDAKVWWNPGDHFLLKFLGSTCTCTTTCTRAYTPLKSEHPNIDFSVIVKVYAKGIVSNYLNTINIGDQTLWRGPYGAYDSSPNKFKRILMIAQGTGIAPFISIIENILDNEEDITKIILYSCVKTDKTILLRNRLYSFRQYWNFSYKIFCSETSKNVQFKYQEPIVAQKLRLEDIMSLQPVLSNDDQILLCGSSQFMGDLEILILRQDSSLKNIIKF